MGKESAALPKRPRTAHRTACTACRTSPCACGWHAPVAAPLAAPVAAPAHVLVPACACGCTYGCAHFCTCAWAVPVPVPVPGAVPVPCARACPCPCAVPVAEITDQSSAQRLALPHSCALVCKLIKCQGDLQSQAPMCGMWLVPLTAGLSPYPTQSVRPRLSPIRLAWGHKGIPPSPGPSAAGGHW